MQVPPSSWQATLFHGVRTRLTDRLVHYAGLPRKIPAFWEQEATIYHQENMGWRGWGGGAHRLFLSWQEGWC